MWDQIEGGHVLVIGSASPWIEAILVEMGAEKVTTLEYIEIKNENRNARVQISSIRGFQKHVLWLLSNQIIVCKILFFSCGSRNPPLRAVTKCGFQGKSSSFRMLNIVLPDDFNRLWLDNHKSPLFDAVVTFSSVEHSGLGRYGDGIGRDIEI